MEPPKETHFPPEFLNYFHTMCIYINYNHILGKKIKFLYGFKMAAK